MLVRRMVGSRLVVASLEGRLLVADCMQRAVWVACIVSYCMHDSEHWWIAVAKDSFDPPSSFLPSPRHELDVCRRFADVLRTFCGRFADALRMFCRRFADVYFWSDAHLALHDTHVAVVITHRSAVL